MKKISAIILMLFALATTVGAESDIQININNEKFENQTEATIINDRVLVPMREIFEYFGAKVYWDGGTKTVTAVTDGDAVILQIDNDKLFKPGEDPVELDVAPTIINDRTMVPIRAVAAGLGADVDWDGDTRCVSITFEQAAKEDIETVITETIPATIEIEGLGTMTAELYPEVAPETVANFVKLANEGFYDSLVFHRVIDGFMIQGGGYDKDMNLKEAESINGEFKSNGFANPLKHTTGVLSMARTSDPNSASSQFFIMDGDYTHLDGEYAAFGKLTDGFDVLEKISELQTHALSNGMEDVPVELPIIKSIRAEINE